MYSIETTPEFTTDVASLDPVNEPPNASTSGLIFKNTRTRDAMCAFIFINWADAISLQVRLYLRYAISLQVRLYLRYYQHFCHISEALVVYYTCIITRHPYHVLSHNGLQALEESTFSPLRKKRWGTWARAHVSHKHPPSMSPALCETWIAIAFPYRVRLYFPVHLLSRRLMKSCLSRGNVDDINYDLSLELLVLFSTTYL